MQAVKTLHLPRPMLDPVLGSILLLALCIALVGPFDLPLDLVSGGARAMRLVLIAGLTLAGAACAHRAGLRMTCEEPRWPLAALAAGLGVAVYVCVADAFLFRHQLPAEYLKVLQTDSLNGRLSYYILRAFQENVIYRLFVFSALTLLVTKARGADAAQLPLAVVWGLAFGTQILNVSFNVLTVEPASAAMLGYNFVRYVIPGALWGWMYWRFGFAAAELAHVSCHVMLQPALGVLI